MVHHASSFRELLDFRFAGETNAACWNRTLPGDFAEVVRLLGPGEDIVPLDEMRLRGLRLGARGKEAVEVMLGDLATLRSAGRDPVLNIVYGYEKDEDPIIPTDVFSWHVDSAPIESDTWLCTYHGAPSEALDPEAAILKVSDPAIRAQLLELYQTTAPSDLSAIGCATAEALAKEGESFTEWLAENHYDLHYSARPGAKPYSFGIFNLWRIAVQHPDNAPNNPQVCSAITAPGAPSGFRSQVSASPPCVHRAPITGGPRLLLIS